MSTAWPVIGTWAKPEHPRGWEWVPLLEIADLVTGHTPSRSKPEYWNGGVSWINLNEIRQLDGKVCQETELQISDAGVANSSAVIHPAGTVCMSRTASVGFVTQMGRPMATSQDFVNWICGPEIAPEYLVKALRASRQHVLSLCSGSTHKTMYVRDAERLRVLLPPIEEQRRIAAVLDAADALRAKRRQALVKLDTLTHAIFVDMFGDPVSNPQGWPTMPLAEFGTLDRGVSRHRPRNDPALLGGDWPLIQTGDVANSGGYIGAYSSTYSDLGLAQSKIWPAGTLCITIAANIAKTGILMFDACFPDSVVGFTTDVHGGTEYVRAFMRFLQPVLERQAPESAQKNINLKVLRSLEMPVPPAAEVARFASAVASAVQLASGCESSREGLDDLFTSLQQRAFRGDL